MFEPTCQDNVYKSSCDVGFKPEQSREYMGNAYLLDTFFGGDFGSPRGVSEAFKSKLHLRLWLNYNAMLHQTIIYFCLNEAKRLCQSHCSLLFDDVE